MSSSKPPSAQRTTQETLPSYQTWVSSKVIRIAGFSLMGLISLALLQLVFVALTMGADSHIYFQNQAPHFVLTNYTSGNISANHSLLAIEAAKEDVLPNMSSHCVFVLSQLWGNQSGTRTREALNWYLNATVRSVNVATENAPSHIVHVGQYLAARDWYASPAVGAELDQKKIISTDRKQWMHKTTKAKKCGIITIMRLDADDLLTPASFHNIDQGWRNSERACTSSDCPRVMVTGMSTVVGLNIAPASNDQPPFCFLFRHNRDGKKFFSQGLSVTMPVSIWLEYFGGRPDIAYSYPHFSLFDEIRKAMKKKRIVTYRNDVRNHSLYMKTPLSGHYSFDKKKMRNCSYDYLAQQLGKDTGRMVFGLKSSIPKLSKKEWSENTFIKSDSRLTGKR